MHEHNDHQQKQKQQRHVGDSCSTTTQWGCDKDKRPKIKRDINERNLSRSVASSSSSCHYPQQNNKSMATATTSYHPHHFSSFYSPTTIVAPQITAMTTPPSLPSSSLPSLQHSNSTSTTTVTKPGFPYNKKERTTYVGQGGSSYISFPLAKQEKNIPTTAKKPSSSASSSPVATARTEATSNNNNVTTERQHKPFRCNECGQTFSRSHNLKSHSATHSLVRPYKVIKNKNKHFIVSKP